MLRKGKSPPKSQPARPSPKPVHAPSPSNISLHRLSDSPRCLGLCLPLPGLWPSVRAEAEFFRLDDGEYVVNNPHIHDGLTAQSIGWAFTSFDAMNWHPLTWLSLQLDYELHGLSAGGYRLTNVILHAISSVLLLLVLARMTGAFWPIAVVAALCPAPVACGIGCLGRRAQRCVEHPVLDTHHVRLRVVCAASQSATVSAGVRLVCPGPDGQADGSHVALCPAAARLLASAPPAFRVGSG